MFQQFERQAAVLLTAFAIRVLAGLSVERRATTEDISPLSIPYTELLDGDDGPWSTFNISIGNPPQDIRVLPGTSQSSIWAVLSGGCTVEIPAPCAYNRGYIFVPDVSSTYSQLDAGANETLDYGAVQSLGYNGSAVAGYDIVALGNISITGQIIEGLTEFFPFLGVIGLATDPLNNNTGREHRSLLTNLRDAALIPSLSWSYTAGARYTNPVTWGSLTIGGYDANRFQFYEDENITFPIRTDSTRQFLVGLQYMYTDLDGGKSLLPTGIYADVDSLVPEFWLPTEACTAFETAFNITWNDTAQLYTLNNETRYNLLAANPNFTLYMSTTLSNQATVAINLPYAAFDAYATPPKVESDTYYFPLRRAQNDSQYTLGRTLLQEAILLVDYERLNFSIFPAILTNATPDLVAIEAIYALSTTVDQSKKLSGGAIAGIVIGVVAALIIAAVLITLFLRRRKKSLRKRTSISDKSQGKEKPSPDNNAELDAIGTERIELPTHETAVELQSPHNELDSTPVTSPRDSRVPFSESGSPLDVKSEDPLNNSTTNGSHSQLPAYSTSAFPVLTDGHMVEIHDVLSELPGSEVRQRKWSWESGTTNV